MRTIKPVFLFSALAISLPLAGALVGCSKEPAAATSQPAPAVEKVAVTVVPARVQPLQRKVHVVGTLVGLESAALSNKVPGMVTAVSVDLSSRVKPNAPLATIDTRRYVLALEQSRQTLQETLAKLGLKELPGAAFDVSATAPVRKALSELANAKQKLDRAEELHSKKLMSEYEYFDIVSSHRVAESNLENARDEARALLAQAQQYAAQTALRQKDLDDAVICAPDGQTPSGQTIDSYAVVQRSISVGEYLKEGSPAFQVVADHVLKLDARVPERYLSDVALKQDVAFTTAACKNEIFHGAIGVLDPSVEPASRTFLIEAYVDNAAGRLRPGSFIEGDILIRQDPAVNMVPLDAITSFVGVNKIYVVDGDKVHQVQVQPGQQDGTWVEIDQSVPAGQLVVTSGQSKLFDGAAIRITATTAPAATPANTTALGNP